MNRLTRIVVAAFLITPLLAAAAPATPARQDPNALRAVAEQFLLAQAAGLPGEVSVKVGALDPRTALAGCPAPEAFLQPGARAWGKTTVGVRCTAPSMWTIFLQAQVNVKAEYVAAAVPLAQGQPVGFTLRPGRKSVSSFPFLVSSWLRRSDLPAQPEI